MSNPLFTTFGAFPSQQPAPQQMQPTNPIQNGSNMIEKLKQFASMVQGNPQQIVQNLLNSGRMSQSEFASYAQTADALAANMKNIF
jgi:hypothetical protein